MKMEMIKVNIVDNFIRVFEKCCTDSRMNDWKKKFKNLEVIVEQNGNWLEYRDKTSRMRVKKDGNYYKIALLEQDDLIKTTYGGYHSHIMPNFIKLFLSTTCYLWGIAASRENTGVKEFSGFGNQLFDYCQRLNEANLILSEIIPLDLLKIIDSYARIGNLENVDHLWLNIF
jgi:hypothetical protein